MSNKKEHRVPNAEHNRGAGAPKVDWENARVFLEIARHKSFRAAAGALGQSVNALRRKLDQFEGELGAPLLTRHVDGVRLTEEGERVQTIAQRMELDSFDLIRAAAPAERATDGVVRLAVTEGLGSFWIAPRLIEFIRANPRVLVDLHCAMRPADILRLEADVAVQLERPSQKDVRVTRLGRMHLMFFASKSYVERHGNPKTIDDLKKHAFVIQAAEQLVPLEAYEQQVGERIPTVSMRSNISGTHYFGIATGAGIGLLPTYAMAVGATVVPLDIDFRTHHDIWLAYHPGASRIPRVRRVIDWLIDSFSSQRFPWFADSFVHPKAFPKSTPGLAPRDTYAPFRPGEPDNHR